MLCSTMYECRNPDKRQEIIASWELPKVMVADDGGGELVQR